MRSIPALTSRLSQRRGQTSSDYLVLTGVIVAIVLVLVGVFRSELGSAVSTLGSRIQCGASGSGCPATPAPFGLESAAPSGASGAATTAGAGARGATPPAGPAPRGVARPSASAGSRGLGARIADGWNSLKNSVYGLFGGGRTVTARGTSAPPKAPATVATGLGEGIDRFVSLSPDFAGQIRKIQAEGYTIEVGPAGRGTSEDSSTKTITIDADLVNAADPGYAALALAHEMGHAGYTPAIAESAMGRSRAQYVRYNLDQMLKSEGEAELKSLEMRDRLIAGGAPPNLSWQSPNAAEYNRIYARYLQDRDRERARREIGALYEYGEHTSTTGQTYHDYYGERFDVRWQLQQQRGGWPAFENVPA
jgi:hypothetical protein